MGRVVVDPCDGLRHTLLDHSTHQIRRRPAITPYVLCHPNCVRDDCHQTLSAATAFNGRHNHRFG